MKTTRSVQALGSKGMLRRLSRSGIIQGDEGERKREEMGGHLMMAKEFMVMV